MPGLAGAQSLNEEDYLAQDAPVVLTATRLQQSLHDVPGAMTVLDRDMIRRSGARDVAELLRLVPGYLVGGINGAFPVAAYHAPLDEYGVRNLVFVDGRSVYSSFHLGGTYRGMQSVQVEDIERIEVLRGANSAAYGANAMFGVINIVTRHTADSPGQEVQLSAGSGGVRDGRASLGWGDVDASHRLSVAQREDSGHANTPDDRRLRMVDWRTDIRPAADQNLMLRAGASKLEAGRTETPTDPQRTVQWDDWYLQGRWQRQLSEDSQLQISADFSREHYSDFVAQDYYITVKKQPYFFDTVVYDYSGNARRANLELQHQLRLDKEWRAVWGLGWKEEQVESWPLYSSHQPIGYHESRAFGNLEWRPGERWTVNAGLFVGDHNWLGRYVMPRLMFNHHFTPDHTLRLGVTRSLRTNSMLELAGDVRFYNPSGKTLYRNWSGSPDIRPEQLKSQEISYFGQIRPLRLTVDVRAYRERVTDMVGVKENPAFNPGLPSNWPLNPRLFFFNQYDFMMRGIEYQLSWSLREGSRLQWQQNFSRLEWDQAARTLSNQPPIRASSLAWIQTLPAGRNLSLSWSEHAEVSWHNAWLPRSSRLDLRLAQNWNLGSMKAETALTVQALNGDQDDVHLGQVFKRRAFLTLRLEH